MTTEDDIEQIAIIGLAGRYPSSPDIGAFWDNLREGRDCLRTFTAEELEELGIGADHYERDNFVPRGAEVPDARGFDARFFGFTPQEAAMMDPQSRVLLETSWEAFEDAGYEPSTTDEPVGVFAGSNPNDYAALLGVADPSDSLAAFNQLIGSDKDFLATRVSHRLNLRGPALTVQTACSTSLVAVHLATQSLLAYECGMALAGGVSLNFRQGVGYFAQPGMILSPSGTCRAFDAQAEGTTLGQGCGMVLLKRLSDAVADDDHIYAVVKASAINNDGAEKMSYTAPSEDGQAEVISLVHQLADVESDSIGYIEAHGTGTKLGDPVEIAALTRAFAPGTNRKQFCAIGSAKTNFGHTDAAAGITGFLKAALSLHHREIPPSIHFDTPNPAIGFEETPFYVNTELAPFVRNGLPRRAGVSAFGIGGTNAHVMLEEAPPRRSPGPTLWTLPAPVIVPVSAKSAAAVDTLGGRIDSVLKSPDCPRTIDIAYTLRHGRVSHAHRRASVVRTDGSELTIVSGVASEAPTLVALYPGQGMQYPAMTAELHAKEPAYAEAFDACIERFEEILKHPLGQTILSPNAADHSLLDQTWITQPALFAVEYGLTALLGSWGLSPDVVIGHSIGEFAAGVEAGVFSLDDATRLVAERGRLMQSMAPGSMASVLLGSDELASVLPDDVAIAAQNAPNMTVVSGPDESLEVLLTRLDFMNVRTTRLSTSHAFHSPMMDEAASRFEEVLSKVQLQAPSRPMVSNVTGDWLSDYEATDPSFWASQIRNTVRFNDCITRVATEREGVAFVEIGPGRAMGTFAARNAAVDMDHTTFATTTPKADSTDDQQSIARRAVAALWCAGVEPDWDGLGQGEGQRVPLPTYPFERQEHWSPSRKHQLALPRFGELTNESTAERNPNDQWLWAPTWSRLPYEDAARDVAASETIVAFVPATRTGDFLIRDLQAEHDNVIAIRPGSTFVGGGNNFVVRPGFDDDFALAARHIDRQGGAIATIIHAWPLETNNDPAADRINESLASGVDAVLSIGRHFGPIVSGANLLVATRGTAQVWDDEKVVATNAAMVGVVRVLGLEFAQLQSRVVDLADTSVHMRRALLAEAAIDSEHTHVALRGSSRWVPDVMAVPPQSTRPEALATAIRPGGHYVIVGGTGGVGLSLATHLATTYKAKLSLVSRSGRPDGSPTASPETKRRFEVLEALDETAGGVAVFAADITSADAMASLVTQAEARFGPIHGVISTAGVADQGGMIQRRTAEQMESSISSKVHGSLVLTEVFDGYDLDFMALSSSVAATLWHNRFAQVGYVTANTFVESLPAAKPHMPIVAIAWDDWTEIGMSVRAAEDFSRIYGDRVNLVDELNSFSPKDGVRVFEQILAAGHPVVIVSPTDLRDRVRDDIHQESPFLTTALSNDEDTPVGQAQSVDAAVRLAWCDLLGYPEVDDDADFFELGGDSLQAARLADRLSRVLDLDIPLQVFFNNSTLVSMIAAIEEISPVEGAALDLRTVLPLTPGQRRFLDRGNPNPNHFNIAATLKSQDHIDSAVLEQACRRLVETHPSFRTAVDDAVNGQRILSADDWHGLSTEVVVDHAEMSELCGQLQERLSIASGEVFQMTLIDVSSTGEQRVFVTMHHLVSDRISLLLFLDALSDEYNQIRSGTHSPVRPRAGTSDWLSHLVDDALSPVGERTAKDLAGLAWHDAPGCIKPASRQPHENTNADGAALKRKLDARSLTLPDNRSAAEVVLLGLGRALMELHQDDAAAIEVINNGRRLLPDSDVARQVGFFLTYVPVLISAEMAASGSGFDAVREQLENNWRLDALATHGSESTINAVSAVPQIDVLFNFMGREISAPPAQQFQPTGEARGNDVASDGYRAHAIAVSAEVLEDNSIDLRIVYSEALHVGQYPTRLADLLVEHVEALCSTPSGLP